MAGRKATTSIIPGEYALSVNYPEYEHPKKWTYVSLLDVSTLATGHTPSRKFPEYWNGKIPWMSVGDARKVDGKTISETKEYTNQLGIDNSAAVLLPKDTVCLSRTASIGYSVRLGREMATSQGFVNFICGPLINPKFLQNLFLAEKRFLYSISEGTAHTTIYYPEVKAFNVALPPLTEQKRIVAKLDELFRHLDTLKTRLKKIPQILKNFRQAVLTQAVTGKLTEEWRKGRGLDEWKETTLEHLVLFAGNGLSKRSGEGENLTVLRLADFKNGIRVIGNERKIQLTEKEQIKYTLNNNDLLIIRVNGSVDLAGLFILYNDNGNKEAFCDHFIRLTVNSEKIIPLYLTYISNNGDGRLYLKNSLSTSAGQNTINQKSVKGLPINLPSKKEQTEIVNRVEHLFAKVGNIESQYKNLKTKIDSLPQAILAKAFKGELVEQLDTDGDAKELLEEIKKMKAEVTKPNAKRNKK